MNLSSQEQPETGNSFFTDSYESAGRHFRQDFSRVQDRWPSACLQSNPLENVEQDLSINWIYAPPAGGPEKLLVLTAGQHGVEGYAGAAMISLFIAEFLPHMDPHTTGLMVIHPINPWGMKHLRRTNQNNVDLNRNFTYYPADLNPNTNPNYDRLQSLLNPRERLDGMRSGWIKLMGRLLVQMSSLGARRFQKASLMGQHRHPQGLYFGGAAWQPETCKVMDLFRQHMPGFPQVVLLDMHTGYGRSGELSVVTSPLEPRTSSQLAAHFGYPNITRATAAEFYTIHGDMVDFAYRLAKQEFPQARFFGAAFEFGTLGGSRAAAVQSLARMVFENQLYHYGSASPEAERAVRRDFLELFYPSQESWRRAAAEKARQAFGGILAAEGFLC